MKLFFTRSSGHHQIFLNFRFFSRKSQSQEKLPKKITHFTIQFHSKNLTHFMNLNSLDIENNMLLQHSQKTFLNLLTIFQQTCFCLVAEKTFALHRFLTPKTAFLKHFESNCPFISVLIRKKRRSKILSDGRGWGGGGRLNNYIKPARFLGLVKYFTIFHFNQNFCKFN